MSKIIPPKLTEEQVSIIQYFWAKKGDLTVWTGWDECQDILEHHHPEVLAAVRALEIAEKTLDTLVSSLEGTYDEG